MKKTFITALCASLMLAACGDKSPSNQTLAASSAEQMCASSNLNQQIQAQAKTYFDDVRQYAQHQPNLDENKLLAMFEQFQFNASPATQGRDACEVQLSITLPASIMQLSSTNAPLLNQNPPQEMINNQLRGSNMRFDGQTLTLLLNFAVSDPNHLALKDENLKSAMRLLAESLSPAGMKEQIDYQGKIMRRAEALQWLRQPKQPEIAMASAVESQLEEVQPISSFPIASNVAAPEIMQPETPPNKIEHSELQAARQANNEADQSIKSAWKKITPDIQQSLVEEQRNWESKKRQSCRSAAAKGSSAQESQYLQIQCDTRLTRERVQYLKGFSVE